MSDHKPITEDELKEMEDAYGLERGHLPDMARLIAEVRRLRKALEHYGTTGLWSWQGSDAANEWKDVFEPTRPDLRGQPGYKLARVVLGWEYPPAKPCDNPRCDGVEGQVNYGDQHRCFRDGRWLDDGGEI